MEKCELDFLRNLDLFSVVRNLLVPFTACPANVTDSPALQCHHNYFCIFSVQIVHNVKWVQLQSEEEGVVCAGQGGGNRKGEASRVFPAPPHGTNSKVLGTAHSWGFCSVFLSD